VKNKTFAFRISEQDLKAIQRKAAQAGMDVTKYITACALNKKIVTVDGLKELTAEVKAVGRNLNQQTTLAHMGRITATNLTECMRVFEKVCEVLLELAGRVR
jgi:hypothetical protein